MAQDFAASILGFEGTTGYLVTDSDRFSNHKSYALQAMHMSVLDVLRSLALTVRILNREAQG